jgi:hypothetical protein
VVAEEQKQGLGGQRQKESGGTRETETRETERCYGQRLDKYAILHSQ